MHYTTDQWQIIRTLYESGRYTYYGIRKVLEKSGLKAPTINAIKLHSQKGNWRKGIAGAELLDKVVSQTMESQFARIGLTRENVLSKIKSHIEDNRPQYSLAAIQKYIDLCGLMDQQQDADADQDAECNAAYEKRRKMLGIYRKQEAG